MLSFLVEIFRIVASSLDLIKLSFLQRRTHTHRRTLKKKTKQKQNRQKKLKKKYDVSLRNVKYYATFFRVTPLAHDDFFLNGIEPPVFLSDDDAKSHFPAT